MKLKKKEKNYALFYCAGIFFFIYDVDYMWGEKKLF